MGCNCAERDLLLYAHGETPWFQTLALRFHLRRCERCRKELARWERVSHAIRGRLAPASSALAPLGNARPSQALKAVLIVGLTVLALTAAVYSYVSSVPRRIDCDPPSSSQGSPGAK